MTTSQMSLQGPGRLDAAHAAEVHVARQPHHAAEAVVVDVVEDLPALRGVAVPVVAVGPGAVDDGHRADDELEHAGRGAKPRLEPVHLPAGEVGRAARRVLRAGGGAALAAAVEDEDLRGAPPAEAAPDAVAVLAAAARGAVLEEGLARGGEVAPPSRKA